jgi:ribosomal protein L11 methyltransferase
MSWLEMTIRAHRREWRYLEGALAQVGALSVTLLDAADEPILEPGAGEMPLWKELLVTALFDGSADRRGLQAVLQDLVYTLDDERFSFREVADADWTRAWMDQYRPMRFGARLWVCPSGMELPAEAHAEGEAAPVVVQLDPGLAFGSGTHPTTALCLEWLDGLAARGALAGSSVLDFGCGSGILAIAALKLGAARAIGVDNDPQALVASRDNAQRNGIDDTAFEVLDPEAARGARGLRRGRGQHPRRRAGGAGAGAGAGHQARRPDRAVGHPRRPGAGGARRLWRRLRGPRGRAARGLGAHRQRRLNRRAARAGVVRCDAP